MLPSPLLQALLDIVALLPLEVISPHLNLKRRSSFRFSWTEYIPTIAWPAGQSNDRGLSHEFAQQLLHGQWCL